MFKRLATLQCMWAGVVVYLHSLVVASLPLCLLPDKLLFLVGSHRLPPSHGSVGSCGLSWLRRLPLLLPFPTSCHASWIVLRYRPFPILVRSGAGTHAIKKRYIYVDMGAQEGGHMRVKFRKVRMEGTSRHIKATCHGFVGALWPAL